MNEDWASIAYREIIEAGTDWADKDAAAKFLDDTRKPTLAQITNKMDAGSQAAKDSLARAHPEYKEHLEKLRVARKAANLSRVKYDAAKTLASLRQTQESLKKAEMGLR
jgi:hypothetical protein